MGNLLLNKELNLLRTPLEEEKKRVYVNYRQLIKNSLFNNQRVQQSKQNKQIKVDLIISNSCDISLFNVFIYWLNKQKTHLSNPSYRLQQTIILAFFEGYHWRIAQRFGSYKHDIMITDAHFNPHFITYKGYIKIAF